MPHPQMPDQNAKVTSADEWRKQKEQGFIVSLPASGHNCRVRRTMDLLHMVRTGRIPNPLAGLVQGFIKGEKSTISMADMDRETVSEMVKLVNTTVSRMMLEPRVQVMPEFDTMGDKDLYEWAKRLEVETPPQGAELTEEEYSNLRDELTWKWEPREGFISAEDIELEDRFFLFSIAQGGTADAESFRQQQAQFMAAASAGEGISTEAKQPAGDKG